MNYMFDCDDTLYDMQQSFRRTFLDIFGPHDQLEALYLASRKIGDEVFPLQTQGLITNDDSGILRIYKTCQQFGLPCSLEKAADFQERYVYHQQHITMSDGFHAFFKSWKANKAILTNGQNAHQRMKLTSLGVFDYFDPNTVYTSDELGLAKPNPAAFQKVIEKVGGQDWCYVGDSYHNDMEGAKAAGLKTIHFDRHHHGSGPAADYVVYSEDALFCLLKEGI